MGPNDPFSSAEQWENRAPENEQRDTATKFDHTLQGTRSYRGVLIPVLGALGGMGFGISSLFFPWHDLLKIFAATVLGYLFARVLLLHHEGKVHLRDAWRVLLGADGRHPR